MKTAAFLPANNRAFLHLSTRRDYVEEKNVIENQIKIISTVVKFYIDELYVGKKMWKKKFHFSHVDHFPPPTTMLETVSMKRKYCDENIFSILRLFHLICRQSQEWHCVRWRRRWGECFVCWWKTRKFNQQTIFLGGDFNPLSVISPPWRVVSPTIRVCCKNEWSVNNQQGAHTRVTRRLKNTLCFSCAYISPTTSLGLITKSTFHLLCFSTLLSPNSRKKICWKTYLQSSSPGWIEFPLVLRRINSRINNLLYALSRNVVVVDCEWLIALHHRKAGFRHASISPVP